ncbi:MAG TPA: hypothetical protein DEP84_13145 [Chloroflexi bacterium]|nr:hypothetical protein [Chloroflexota bacterium]
MLKDIVAVQAVGEFQVQLRFEDGTEGVIDVTKLVEFTGIFEPLRDREYFSQVRGHPRRRRQLRHRHLLPVQVCGHRPRGLLGTDHQEVRRREGVHTVSPRLRARPAGRDDGLDRGTSCAAAAVSAAGRTRQEGDGTPGTLPSTARRSGDIAARNAGGRSASATGRRSIGCGRMRPW